MTRRPDVRDPAPAVAGLLTVHRSLDRRGDGVPRRTRRSSPKRARKTVTTRVYGRRRSRMSRSPAHLELGAGRSERSTATAKFKSHPVKGHPGVTLRVWADRAGRPQRRYDATLRGPDRIEHSRTFRRLGDAEAWLEEERTNARRGGWIDPTRGNETLGSFFARWKRQAAETGRP